MRVWFIEDDEQLSALIAEGLRFLGHEVQTSQDLTGLRARLELGQPDLLLLDLELGTRNAADLLPFLHVKYPDLYLIVASSHSDGVEIAKCYDAGIDAYIKKPYDIRELDCVMRRLTQESTSQVDPCLPESYHWRDHALWQGSQPIQKIPDVEWRILRFLLDHEGHVVSKKELCEAIWGEQGMDDRLNAAISRLRKLLPDDCPWTIANHKRVGYVILSLQSMRPA
ncbi:MAG: response regulator transcription factor [Parabacteroides sp.]